MITQITQIVHRLVIAQIVRRWFVGVNPREICETSVKSEKSNLNLNGLPA